MTRPKKIEPGDGLTTVPNWSVGDEAANVRGTFAGVSIRDWFAGLAMQGMLAATEVDCNYPKGKDIALWSYDYADAMLAVRQAPPTKE